MMIQQIQNDTNEQTSQPRGHCYSCILQNVLQSILCPKIWQMRPEILTAGHDFAWQSMTSHANCIERTTGKVWVTIAFTPRNSPWHKCSWFWSISKIKEISMWECFSIQEVSSEVTWIISRLNKECVLTEIHNLVCCN